MVEARDLVFAISNSGETTELLAFVEILKKDRGANSGGALDARLLGEAG